MSKHQERADRQSAKKDAEVQKSLGDIVGEVQRITAAARAGDITWEQRAEMLAALTGNTVEEWTPIAGGNDKGVAGIREIDLGSKRLNGRPL